MADIKLSYGSTTSITASSLPTLGSTSTTTSSTVDNTTNLYVDALLEFVFTTATGVSSTGTVEVWGKASVDNSDFDDDVNDRLIGIVVMSGTGIQTRKRIFQLGHAFGGSLPPYWQIRVVNSAGAAFTAGTLNYRGILMQSV